MLGCPVGSLDQRLGSVGDFTPIHPIYKQVSYNYPIDPITIGILTNPSNRTSKFGGAGGK